MNSPSSAVTPQPLTQAQMARCLDALRADFDEAQVIYRNGDRVVIRWREAGSSDSIVIKMRSRPDLKGKLRWLFRVASCEHEWRNLARLSSVNMPVPRPLGFSRVVPNIAGYTDALFMEDLGECESATEYLKRLIQAGQNQQVLGFENGLIELTERIVGSRTLDVDHGLVNTVVQASGRVVRLDFELARRVICILLFPRTYGKMLGRLIGDYAFAVQPDVGRATRFAERLYERMRPPRQVLKHAGSYSRDMMRGQLQRTGIDTRLVLPWD